MNIRKIALLLELLITIILWSGIIAIPYLEYDDNYAVLFYGLVFSIITFGLFIGYWIHLTKGKKWRKLEFLIFFLLNSPFTFCLFSVWQDYKT